MTTYYDAVQGGSRICDSDRVDQSGADNADVVDWVKTNDFILAVNINSNGKDTRSAQYKLRWRDVTDEGSFADVGATGEIHYNAATVLVNGAAIDVSDRRCDSQGEDAWQDGEEVEGASLTDAIDLPDEYETEIHFALDCSGAEDGHEYEFELYDNTQGASRGTCGASLTIYEAAETVTISKMSLTLTGKAVKGNEVITPAKMTLTSTGKAVSVLVDETVTISKMVLTWTGKAVKANEVITIAKTALTWTGKAVTITGVRIKRGLNRLGMSLRID